MRRIDEDTTAFSELQTGGVNMILYPTQYDIDDVKNGVYEEIRYQTAPGLYQQLFVLIWMPAAPVRTSGYVRQYAMP